MMPIVKSRSHCGSRRNMNLHFGAGNETMHHSLESSVASLVQALKQENIEVTSKSTFYSCRRAAPGRESTRSQGRYGIRFATAQFSSLEELINIRTILEAI